MLLTGCVAGASVVEDLPRMLSNTGFVGLAFSSVERADDVIHGLSLHLVHAMISIHTIIEMQLPVFTEMAYKQILSFMS